MTSSYHSATHSGSPFAISIAESAERITTTNSRPGNPPPAFVAESPFEEVLVGEVAASLPPELAAHFTARASASAPDTTTIAELHDWLGVAALYRWVSGDRLLAREFLAAVRGDPQGAGLALVRALARRIEPPPRSRRWLACDGVGLALQLLGAVLVLAGRGLLFFVLGHLGLFGVPPVAIAPASVLAGLTGTGPIGILQPRWPLGALALGGAAVWLALEANSAPRLMEALRRLPARVVGEAPPLAWRADTFYALWLGQAAICLGYLCIRYWLQVTASPGSLGALASEVGVGGLITALALVVVARGRQTLRLGGPEFDAAGESERASGRGL